MDILNNIIISEYQKQIKDCLSILSGIDPGSALYEKTICIMNDISQKIDILKGADYDR